MEVMFGSSLPPIVCERDFFCVACVRLRVVVSSTFRVVCLLCLSPSCVLYVPSFSGLYICDCPSGIR